jgi:hypothetical protein
VTGLTVQAGIELEAIINPIILKIPPCRNCEHCTTSNTKLCLVRLKARNELLISEGRRLAERGTPKKKSKKRKAGEPGATPPAKKGRGPGKSWSAGLKTPTSSSASAKKKLMMQKSDGQLKPRVTSQGNKRMSIPDDVFPDFCRMISPAGTSERTKLVNDFVEQHPTISMRQVNMKLSEITTRNRPECVPEPHVSGPPKKGRAFHFYLRPRFYRFLPPSERPPEWEKYAEQDEQLWLEEQAKKKEAKKEKDSASKKEDAADIAAGGDETEDEEKTAKDEAE